MYLPKCREPKLGKQDSNVRSEDFALKKSCYKQKNKTKIKSSRTIYTELEAIILLVISQPSDLHQEWKTSTYITSAT